MRFAINEVYANLALEIRALKQEIPNKEVPSIYRWRQEQVQQAIIAAKNRIKQLPKLEFIDYNGNMLRP